MHLCYDNLKEELIRETNESPAERKIQIGGKKKKKIKTFNKLCRECKILTEENTEIQSYFRVFL